MIVFLQIVFIFICILLIGIILIQAGKGHGLAGAFGSFAGNAAQNLFGARTTDILTKITAYITVLFFSLAVFIAYLQAKETKSVMLSVTKQEESKVATKEAKDVGKKLSDLTKDLFTKDIKNESETSNNKVNKEIEVESSVVNKVQEAPETTTEAVIEDTNKALKNDESNILKETSEAK